MAKIGANYPAFKREDKAKGIRIGKLVSANLTVTLASGELYADDGLAEQLSEFASGSIAMETDDMEDPVASEIYGCKVEEGTVIYNKDDTAPMGSIGYYKAVMRRGVKYYQGYYYPRARAALGNDNAQTRGSNITFQTSSTTFTVFADDAGNWRLTKTFNTSQEAVDWLKERLCIADSATVPAQEYTMTGMDKAVSELIDTDVKITWTDTVGKVTGTIKNVSGFDKYSKNPKLQSGHYFPILVDDLYKGKPITWIATEEKTAEDLECIVRLDDLMKTTKKLTAKAGSAVIFTLDFSGATLAPGV